MAISDVMYSSVTGEWGTPQNLFDVLDNEFSFTLDPAATETNAKCENFFVKELDALSITSGRGDGLKQVWTGSVFLNPPYSRSMKVWIKKAYEEAQSDADVVVCLLPARTDTAYFHDYCMKAKEIRFIRGRLKFVGSSNNSAPFPSMVVVFKKGDFTPTFSSMDRPK